MGGMMMQQQQPMGVMPGQPQMGMNPMAGMMMPQMQQQQQPQGLVVIDPLAVANAAASALDAAFGGIAAAPPLAAPTMAAAALPVQQQAAPPFQSMGPTRVLVLLNMVMDEDLATSEDHKMLEEEVGEEVSKYGKLLSIKVPRHQVSFFILYGVIFVFCFLQLYWLYTISMPTVLKLSNTFQFVVFYSIH